nr:hypothetical protein [uncultured Oscillibacter sp.]
MSILNHLKNLVSPEAEDDYEEDMTSAWALPAESSARRSADREVRIRTTTQLMFTEQRPIFSAVRKRPPDM